MKKILFIALFLSFSTFGSLGESKQLIELFSVENEPGEGTLEFGSKAEDMEKIQFGAVSGHYGLGMIFPGKSLPPPYNKDFAKQQLIQLALGTMKGKLETKVPQFAALTLIARRIPTSVTTFSLIVPSEKKTHLGNTALLLFTSPNTPADQKDEEKLQKTFFGREGSIRITPVGTPKSVVIKADSGKVNFHKQVMQLEFLGKLRTPFTDADRALTGKIQFPFFWPKGKEAEALAAKMAAESLNPPGSPAAAPQK